MKLFCCVAFFLWEQRNKVVHDHVTHNPCAVVLRAQNLCKDYKAAFALSCGRDVSVESKVGVDFLGQVVWKPLFEGWFKLNWAVHGRSGSQQRWVGFLVRDFEGKVMAARMTMLNPLPRGVGSHIGAVLQALSFGLDMGFLDVVVEGTYALFDDFPRRVHMEQTVLDAWVEDVQFLFKKFRRYSVSTVSPRSNKAAMALAKVGSGLLRDRVWMEEIPVEIQAFL